jgi:hypothetical protein
MALVTSTETKRIERMARLDHLNDLAAFSPDQFTPELEEEANRLGVEELEAQADAVESVVDESP